MKKGTAIKLKSFSIYLVVMAWITTIHHTCLTIWFDWETVRFFIQPRPGQYRWLAPWYSGWVDLSDYGIKAASLTLRPLMTWSLQLESLLFGNWVPGYHIFNVALHLACVYFLIQFLRKIGLSIPTAFLGGLLFGVHPLCTQPLWILADRAEVCVLFGGLVALIYYDKHPMLSYAALIFALYSKETAITIPAWLALYDLLFLDRVISLKRSLRFRIRRIAVPTAITLLYLIHRFTIFQGIGGYGSVDHGRLEHVLDVISQNTAWLLTWSHHHPIFIGIFGLMLLMLFLPRIPRNYRFAVLWLVVFLIPVNNLCNKWYLYTPVAATCTILATILDPLIRRSATRYITLTLALFLCIYFSVLSYAELQFQKKNAAISMTIATELYSAHPQLAPGTRVMYRLPPSLSAEAFKGHFFRPSQFTIQRFQPPLESIVWDLNGTRFSVDGDRVWSRSVEAAVRLLYNDITLTVQLVDNNALIDPNQNNVLILEYNPEVNTF